MALVLTLGLTDKIRQILGGVWAQWAIDITAIVGVSATATLDFGNTLAQTSADLTMAVAGAAIGDMVALGTPAAPDANSGFTAFVSAPDVVTVRFSNYSAGAIDPASGDYSVRVFPR